MKACRIAKPIIMPSVVHCVLAVRNPSLVVASQPCLRNSIRNISYVPSVWNNSTKELSKNKTTNHTATLASRRYLVKKSTSLLEGHLETPPIVLTKDPDAHLNKAGNRHIFLNIPYRFIVIYITTTKIATNKNTLTSVDFY